MTSGLCHSDEFTENARSGRLKRRFLTFPNIAKMLISNDAKWTISFYDEELHHAICALLQGVHAGYRRLEDLLREHGADLRMPQSRAMGDGLFELRPRSREGIGRVFYCTMVGKRIVMLHSFVKKTQETPDNELRIARKRMKEVKDHG